MARTTVHTVTRDNGTVTITKGSQEITITVHTGSCLVTLTSGFFTGSNVDIKPIGNHPLTATWTHHDGRTWDITDTRPGMDVAARLLTSAYDACSVCGGPRPCYHAPFTDQRGRRYGDAMPMDECTGRVTSPNALCTGLQHHPRCTHAYRSADSMDYLR